MTYSQIMYHSNIIGTAVLRKCLSKRILRQHCFFFHYDYFRSVRIVAKSAYFLRHVRLYQRGSHWTDLSEI